MTNSRTVAVPVAPDGTMDPRWGKAEHIGLARTTGSTITDWQVVEVGWNALHDAGTEGSHHARVVRFLREQAVTDVVAHHMGDSMQHTLGKLGIRVHLGADGDARTAVTTVLTTSGGTP
jgi:predicted Fe-Mo cluster-binding NifX family protein